MFKLVQTWSWQTRSCQTWSCQAWSWQAWSWDILDIVLTTWSCQTWSWHGWSIMVLTWSWHGLNLIFKQPTRGLGLTFNLVFTDHRWRCSRFKYKKLLNWSTMAMCFHILKKYSSLGIKAYAFDEYVKIIYKISH